MRVIVILLAQIGAILLKGVIMTVTETPTTETPSSPPPAQSRLGIASAAGFVVLAATALIVWLLTIDSQPETNPNTSTSAAASAPQSASAFGQAITWNTGGVNSPAEYVMFCENSPAICGAPAPLPGYLQFCWNSPTLCTVARHN